MENLLENLRFIIYILNKKVMSGYVRMFGNVIKTITIELEKR